MSVAGFISYLVRFIDHITEKLGQLTGWLTLAMVLLSFLVVVLRYAFNLGWIAMQETVLYLHGFIFLIGASYALKADAHVRVDIFYQRFSVKTKALINILGTLLLLLPVLVFIFIISWQYVVLSWQIMEKSPEAGGLPFVYLAKSFILLFTLTLGLQGIAEIGRNVLTLLSTDTAQGGN
jgi:TRAP-type mannitol/chloroaromatic compound transport system permease small subunit